MADPIYTDAHRNECCNAITALAKTICPYAGATKVGTVAVDTTWGAAAKVTLTTPEGTFDFSQANGSKVTLTIPAGTVANGTIITHYGVHVGATLKRRIELDVAQLINDGSKTVSIDVTPQFLYRGDA